MKGLGGREVIAAAGFYTLAFFALTWPAVTRFQTHWFADEVDGLQNVWNLWWVQHAVTVLHQSPWHTDYLHYPYGISLLAHTLNPFNGFVAIGLGKLMSPVAVHNSIVTFAFVGGGVTAFLLAHRLTRAYVPSLLAGFIFTFSSFHFAHAEGHLQLVSLEWIPLFVLLWLTLLEKPTVALGTAAALVLFLVILCDYYYFLYCAITGGILLGWWARHNGGARRFLEQPRMAAFGAFALVALLTSGVLAGSLAWSSLRDPLTGSHPASEFSMDLLSPLIYGGHWRFGWLTSRFWMRLPANIHESSVHLGVSVIALALYAWHKRNAIRRPEIQQFAFLSLFFLVLALGPSPQIAGKAILGNIPVLPYALLELLFPPLTISGVPLRMMVMVMLSVAILAAFGFELLLRGEARGKLAAVVLACMLLVEYLPKPIPTLSIAVPEYVGVLRSLPGAEGILDTVCCAEPRALLSNHPPPADGVWLSRTRTQERGGTRPETRRGGPATALRSFVAGLSPSIRGREGPGPDTEIMARSHDGVGRRDDRRLRRVYSRKIVAASRPLSALRVSTISVSLAISAS